jgi:hypothetical protein
MSFLRTCSDHSPICIEFGQNSKFKTTIFHFEKCWLSQEGFADQMATWWHNYLLNDNKAVGWKCKLDKLRSKLKGWNANFRANFRASKHQLTQEISNIEHTMEQQDLSDNENFVFFS